MIRIKMEKDRQGRLGGFIVEGHADYAEEGAYTDGSARYNTLCR